MQFLGAAVSARFAVGVLALLVLLLWPTCAAAASEASPEETPWAMLGVLGVNTIASIGAALVVASSRRSTGHVDGRLHALERGQDTLGQRIATTREEFARRADLDSGLDAVRQEVERGLGACRDDLNDALAAVRREMSAMKEDHRREIDRVLEQLDTLRTQQITIMGQNGQILSLLERFGGPR